MTETPKKRRGRPPKVKAPRVVTPANQGEQIAMRETLQRFLVALNQKDLERSERFRDELVHMMDRLAGLK